MNTGARHIDRLLPRHPTGDGLELDWHVHVARAGMFKKEERYRHGIIRDLSLEGALVEVHEADDHEIGDEVAVRFRGMDGTATIRHIHRSDDGTVLFGVRFRPAPEFRAAIDETVGDLRGHKEELQAVWNRRH